MKTKLLLNVTCALAVICGTSAFTIAQDQPDAPVEIIDQNGQAVNPRVIAGPQAGDANQRRARVAGRGMGGGKVSGGASVKNENGKITITDADGYERGIVIPGARGVTIMQSEKMVEKDGQMITESVGKAIIIGPDGQRHEIDLSGLPVNGTGGLPSVLKMDRAATNKFMIGVSSVPVPAALAVHLLLEPGVGLMVEKIAPDSPAEKAGLQVHDILIYADDSDLKTLDNLMELVDRAGTEKKPLSFTVMRAGKEMVVEVEPVERPRSAIPNIDGLDRGDGQLPNPRDIFRDLQQLQPLIDDLNADGGVLQFRQALPGVIIGDGFGNQELGVENDNFREQMQQQMEAMKAQMEEMKKLLNDK